MQIQRLEEFQIEQSLQQQIGDLLGECFSDYPEDRSYFRQLPDFRYLAWMDQQLVAHLAVEHRIINNDDQLLRIFGIIDLCVAPAFQHQKLATKMLRLLEQLARDHRIDFLVLVAKDHEFYTLNGFQVVDNRCRWLMIHDDQTFGITSRSLHRSLLVKATGEKQWRPGITDFLGHIF